MKKKSVKKVILPVKHTKPFMVVIFVAFSLLILVVLFFAFKNSRFDFRSQAGGGQACSYVKGWRCPLGFRRAGGSDEQSLCCKLLPEPTRTPCQNKAGQTPTSGGCCSPLKVVGGKCERVADDTKKATPRPTKKSVQNITPTPRPSKVSGPIGESKAIIVDRNQRAINAMCKYLNMMCDRATQN